MSSSQVSPVPRVLGSSPPCPQCGTGMAITLVRPVTLGVDERTFQCRKCNFSETALVKFR